MNWPKIIGGVNQVAFICGCAHTGTTLLATMLAAHRNVHVPLDETNMFLKGRVNGTYRLFKLLLVARLRGKKVLVEKTPRHLRKIAEIRRRMPAPRFLITVRDGRDVVSSLLERSAGNRNWAQTRWLTDMTTATREIGQPDVLFVRYEDVVVHTAKTLAAVCAFLDLDYDSTMLEYHKEPRLWFREKTMVPAADPHSQHNAYRNWQVNQPLFDGRGRWKTKLPKDVVKWFQEEESARKLMDNFGYPTS